MTSLSVAPEITAPLGSVTTPEMLPPVAARADATEKRKKIKLATERVALAATRETGFDKNTHTSRAAAIGYKAQDE